ncbi:Ser/Thr protein kinase RdoA (MazF antagonist) [Nocardia sp. GAS34]|uniref:phosphotransferase enzyme family protein n=1 Tax=unclassified Nocardia TaxID=2637762 RepID=UPI003D1AC4DB
MPRPDMTDINSEETVPPTTFSDLSHSEQLRVLDQLTRAALPTHYGIDGTAAILELQRYEDNAVWRVTPDSDQSFVARLSSHDGRTADQQRSEMAWLESLAAAGKVTVPGPLTTLDGDCVVPITVPGQDQAATLALLHWVPGTAEPPYQQPGVAEQMGAATAHLHHNAATTELAVFDRPTWDYEMMLKGAALTDPDAGEHLSEAGRMTLRQVADRIVPAIAECDPAVHSRIHGDLHRENMIALPTGGVGIIDFDDCGWGSPILDIATVLSSIHRIAHTEPGAYARFAQAFLNGYTNVVGLPQGFDVLLEPYLLLRDVFVLNFVSTAMSNTAVAEWGPGRIARIIINMEAYLGGRQYPGALA